jgi:alanine dehydrogenase
MINIKVLKKEDTQKVLKMDEVITTVEEVYEAQSAGNTVIYPLITEEFVPGSAEMDIKSGWIKNKNIYGLKVVSWFENNEKINLPALLGTILILDSTTGAPKGILDGGYITGIRTGAAGAIGAKLLARKNSKKLLVVGAGVVAFYQVAATLLTFPELEKVMIYDGLDYSNAERFVNGLKNKLCSELNIDSGTTKFEAVKDIAAATGDSDIIITVTPSREPIIKKEWVKPGTHFSCIGSDMEGKEEIEPEIFEGAKIYVDDINQCINVGEIEIPIKKGIISEKNITGVIGDVITGKATGRDSDEQITIFDATGTALIDLLTGLLALERAEEKGLGQTVEL